MKKIIHAIILGLTLISFDIVAQNESRNCEEARKKYLELNPDVAKAGMDAWIHYSNYGKREGRIWPPCPNSIAEISNPKPSNDSLFKDIASIGSNSKKEISQYNINNIHNQFDFNEKPLSVLSGSPNEAGLKLNGLKEKEILDNFLRGVDSLPIIIKDIEKSLSKYPKISLESYYKTSKEFSGYILNNNRIIVSKNYKSLNKLKDLGRVTYKNDSFSYLIIPTGTYSKRLEKKLAKLITKNIASLVNKENVEGYIRGIYNVTREYQELCENLIKHKNMKDYSSAFFKVLNAPDESYKYFNYIGQLNNGTPTGFGYLLNNNKQLICSAYWDEGFPVVLYSVNNYHNSKSIDQFHRYIAPSSSNGKYNKRKIDFDVSDYSNSDIRTFNIYVGECNEKNIRSGTGCYFFEGSDEASLQYYKGNWGGSGDRIGEGTHYSNGIATSGKWVNGEISNGTITWPDKSTYFGAINKYRMNGMGKKTYSNGKIEEGLFENGSFSKSLAQLQQEQVQREQEQHQEEIRQELIRSISLEQSAGKISNRFGEFNVIYFGTGDWNSAYNLVSKSGYRLPSIQELYEILMTTPIGNPFWQSIRQQGYIYGGSGGEWFWTSKTSGETWSDLANQTKALAMRFGTGNKYNPNSQYVKDGEEILAERSSRYGSILGIKRMN